MANLTEMMRGPAPVLAPLVLDPMMARMAEKAGFKALYLGGGATGYLKVHLEANLTLTEMAQTALEIRTVSSLPLIFDAAAGWGDPMHMHRTMGMTEAAGFAAIEIEDQILPKRAHHHIGIDHMVPMEFMVEKIKEAVRARRNPDTHIIARTIAIRSSNVDDAIRRCEAYRAAGADSLLLIPYTQEVVRYVGERLEPPLVNILRPGGLASLDMTPAELHQHGFRLLIDPATPLLAAYEAMKRTYAELADGFAIRSRPVEDWGRLQKEQHESIDLAKLIEIERRTTEKPA
ncbi:MAG: isocitrate lyase/PEP mutase family protein [Rhodospirillales bacterium]|nr:MAG: isocitrate lyase/PEP mutase family protein [Rhodospirillales bacterium]